MSLKDLLIIAINLKTVYRNNPDKPIRFGNFKKLEKS